MSLSSNSLFHYTDSLSTLQKIISGGFSPSYCKEYHIAVPMISFCDIPLTSAIKYMDYGDYAIGMNKNWVERNGLNPVNYISINSTLESTLTEGLTASVDVVENINKIEGIEPNSVSRDLLSDNSVKSLDAIIEIYRYHKPYEGRNDHLNKDNYRFYDEREWRYIPPVDHGGFQDYLTLEEYEIYKEENPIKPHLMDVKLTMMPDDIDYIIVRNQENIFPLIEFLENQDNFGSPRKIKLLTTRIVTKEQIEKDF